MNELKIYFVERNESHPAQLWEYESFVVVSSDLETAKKYIPSEGEGEKWVRPERTKATCWGIANDAFTEGQILLSIFNYGTESEL